MNRYKRGGWYGESHRHYLASKGIKTAFHEVRSKQIQQDLDDLRNAEKSFPDFNAKIEETTWKSTDVDPDGYKLQRPGLKYIFTYDERDFPTWQDDAQANIDRFRDRKGQRAFVVHEGNKHHLMVQTDE